MRLNRWPKRGVVRRLYLNTGGSWSVDAWLEPDPDKFQGWKLNFKFKDVETERRRAEIQHGVQEDLEEFFTVLEATASLSPSPSWSDLVALTMRK